MTIVVCTDCGWVGDEKATSSGLMHPNQSKFCLHGNGHLVEDPTDLRVLVWKAREKAKQRRAQRERSRSKKNPNRAHATTSR